MSEIIIPSQERDWRKDTNIPLYAAIGISEKESNALYFEYKENILPKCKTRADALRAIIDHPKWNIAEKIWVTYNMENIVRKDTVFSTAKKFIKEQLGGP
jgi:hypothetical protein